MNKPSFPHRSDEPRPKGLLERAAEVFDFESRLKGENLPPLDIPASAIPPAPVEPASFASEGMTSFPQASAPLRALDWSGPAQPLDRVAMAEAGYLIPGGTVSGLGEEFRIVKRELLAKMRGTHGYNAVPNGNVILVTSAHPGDGKSFCAINLAISLAAENDLEVLLVDGDFAKPGIPQALGIKAETGLMDVLTDPALRIEDVVIRTDMPSLAILAAGKATVTDAEHLGSARTDALIASLVAGRPNRVVIFDSPPLLAASVAPVLAAHVGQTLIVVRADTTTETALRDAAGLLGGCASISLLLNGVKFSASGRRFGTYYGKAD